MRVVSPTKGEVNKSNYDTVGVYTVFSVFLLHRNPVIFLSKSFKQLSYMTVYPKIKLEKLSSKTQEMFTELGIKYSLYDLEIKEMTGLGL